VGLDKELARDLVARTVRWPFRALGALLVVACTAVVATALYGTFVYHLTQSAIFALALLPTTALIIRTVGAAVLTGRVPPSPLWPFPSGVVALVWIAISVAIIQLYAANA
jgi:hypothetical protein